MTIRMRTPTGDARMGQKLFEYGHSTAESAMGLEGYGKVVASCGLTMR